MTAARHDRDDHCRALRRDEQPPRVEPVDDHAGDEPDQEERQEAAERERADRERRVGELDHEPRERDVLHPRPGERDDLPREEEPVVPVRAERAERAAAERAAEHPHGAGSSSAVQRGKRSLDALPIAVGEALEALGEPRGAARAYALEQGAALGRQLEPDTAAIVARPHPLEQARGLQAVDVTGERGS